jgi:CelD/BcsL family acetyltransferase involved in cellulose biosynthesis
MRRIEETPGAASLRAGETIGVKEGVEAFLALMKHDPAKSRFLTPAMHTLFDSLAAAGAAAGWLRLELLTLEGRPAAGAFCFDYANRLFIYNSGMDPVYGGLSPGWALLGRLIQEAAGEGKAAVDFMRGGEEYKFRLGGTARYVERVTIRRR